MEIRVDDNTRTVEIWLTNAEKDDPVLRAAIKLRFKTWKEKKYLPVVFESGELDLYALTNDLLSYNRRRIAQIELQRDKRILPASAKLDENNLQERDNN